MLFRSLDVLACFAERAQSLALTQPEISAEPCIEITGGRHLVVEQVIDTPFIANDLTLGEDKRLLIITGPNMGGKSTYMRQTALIIILAHVGSFVPADKLRIGPIDRIFTRIGASDDLAGGRSTFMVEMTETATILNNASEQSLVLMDEIGRGTSTFDGLSLAWAAAHHMGETTRAFTLFATHYFELTALAQELSGCDNVHLDATEHDGKLIFLHAVKPGSWPNCCCSATNPEVTSPPGFRRKITRFRSRFRVVTWNIRRWRWKQGTGRVISARRRFFEELAILASGRGDATKAGAGGDQGELECGLIDGTF